MEQAAVTAAFYCALFQEEKSARFQDFKDLTAPDEFTASKASIHLLHLARELFDGISNENINCLKSLVGFLDKKSIELETKKTVKCKSQLTVFSSETGGILQRYPESFDDSLRQLWLYGRMNGKKVTISAFILNIATFCKSKRYGTFCFYCEKYFSGKGSKHRCLQRRSCFACHRPILKVTTYINQANLEMYCPSEMEPKTRKICAKCNLSLYNDLCLKIHQEKVCRWGWFCLKCNQYTFRSKFLKTLKNIQEQHICFTISCSYCGKSYLKTDKKTHLCPLLKLKPSQIFPKLAFLQMSFRGSSAVWCGDCKSSTSCSFCIDNVKDETPNLGILLWEQTAGHGHFDLYRFADTDLFDESLIQENELIFRTFQSDIPNKSFKKFQKKNKAAQKYFSKRWDCHGPNT